LVLYIYLDGLNYGEDRRRVVREKRANEISKFLNIYIMVLTISRLVDEISKFQDDNYWHFIILTEAKIVIAKIGPMMLKKIRKKECIFTAKKPCFLPQF
jgi:hypothetical protein